MKTDFSNAKRIWMITDIHFGVRSNSQDWQDIQQDYFDNFFIPLVKKNYKPGDVLLVLGDIFDSRNAINLKVMSMAIGIFEKLSTLFPDGIITILGNHDVWGKTSNDIHSLKSLKWIPNMHIFEEPASVKLGTKKFLLMPWRKDHDAEKECIEAMGAGNEYLIAHTEFLGMQYNKGTETTVGLNYDDLRMFKKVYSGHIHISQIVQNVNMLGSPYQLTRNDANNKKGITLLDLSTEKETYWENTRSPQFIKLRFANVIELTPARLNSIFANNFIDIMIEGEAALKSPINLFLDLLNGSYRRVDFHPVLEEKSDVPDLDVSNFELLKFIDQYVETLPYEDDTKKKLCEFIVKLYHKTEQQVYQSM